jgi:nucleotide-binding universal stress UspA family protein
VDKEAVMKWIVGVDLRPLSLGALHFARWLASTARGESERIVAVHVLEEEHLRAVLRLHHMDEVVTKARAVAQQTLEQEGASEYVRDVEIVTGRRADESLQSACEAQHADGIIIGRMAKRGSHRIVRLGRVARRLLRVLPAPVIVVPPDLKVADLGGGPIVVLTSLGDDAVDACKFAQTMAQRTSRPLVVLHVAADVFGSAPYGFSDATLERVRRDVFADAVRDLDRWIAEHNLAGATATVLHGDVVEQANEFAVQQASPLLVAGSQRLAGPERMFVPSTARELAALAEVPVAVVPPAGG